MSPGAEAHIVSNLKKYTKYEFFIAPYYRSVEGQPSNSKIIQTFEDGKKHFQNHPEPHILPTSILSNEN